MEYEKLVTNYAMSLSASNPLEAVLYLKLLKPEKVLSDTVSSFIISNEQVWFFFDKHRDSLRNVSSAQTLFRLQSVSGEKTARYPRLEYLQRSCAENKQVGQEERFGDRHLPR